MVSWEELIIEDSHHRHTSPLNEDGLRCGCLRFIPLAPQSLSFHLVYHVFIHVRLFETCQAPLSMEFPRQEYWSGLPCPSLGDLPDPRIKPESSDWQSISLPVSHLGNLAEFTRGEQIWSTAVVFKAWYSDSSISNLSEMHILRPEPSRT